MIELPKFKIVHVAVTCALSFTALNYADNLAKENELGEFRCLLVGPEDKFIAQEILYGAKNITVETVYFFHPDSLGRWLVIYEKGIVLGQSK